jgi:hypothetical protein
MMTDAGHWVLGGFLELNPLSCPMHPCVADMGYHLDEGMGCQVIMLKA